MNSTLPVLNLGDTGEAVRLLQQLLLSLFNAGFIGTKVTFNATYDVLTEDAVTDFQQAYNTKKGTNELAVDGFVGKLTWRALGDALYNKYNC